MNGTAKSILARDPGFPAATRERSNVYGFLASVFREEATADLLDQIEEPEFRSALSGAGVSFGIDFFDRPRQRLLEELAVEYAWLFIGPGDHVAPFASVYLGGAGGALWGPSTVWVRTFIATAGFEYRPEFHGLPDHVGVEFEFMQHMTSRQASAAERSDGVAQADCRRVEEEFVSDHLARWLPEFCRRTMERATLPFYRELAGLAAGFMRSESEFLAATPAAAC
ncbi:MAG: molecular chaperone TorD family protein [Rhodospirillales bacterium]|jgi:TorA maturation chaperone TorD|nr:molecular chaperone TorD family protein [Rhodospirillales bacterium]MDP6773403.1 molecular chaperone TorD family protein [Rhodospirillales bacterium]